MNNREKAEISVLPEKYRPMGAWSYFGYSILFAIPLVGFICAFIFACSGSNINRRSYARGWFCGLLISLIVIGIMVALIAFTIGLDPFFNKFVEFLKEAYQL